MNTVHALMRIEINRRRSIMGKITVKWGRFLFDETGEGCRTFGPWHRFIVAAIFLTALFIQLWQIGEPYVREGETAFQELIARRHIELGLGHTKGISTISNSGPDPIYHPTHPPLLQLTLAGLFTILGDSEATSRLIPLASYFLILLGFWRLTQFHLTPNGQIVTLLVVLVAPFSFYFCRVVNFELPVLACIVWTMVSIDALNRQSSRRNWIVLFISVITGALIDWPYPLFVTCLFFVYFMRKDRQPVYGKAVWRAWGLSMILSVAYASVVYGLGAMHNMAHHAKIQTGAYSAQSGYHFPPIFTSLYWWKDLGFRIVEFGTPVLFGMFLVWLFWGFKHRFRNGLHHWCLVSFLFIIAYFGVFSRASERHVWCLFYLTPLFCLTFGMTLERLKIGIRLILLAAMVVFAISKDRNVLTKTPHLLSVQIGKTIAAATEFLPKNKRTAMSGPLLYVNRVDPLPYYARCETGFSHMAAGAAKKDQFLLRFRPEFVVLTDYKRKSPITQNAEFPPAFFDRLQKSYSLVHNQGKTEQWESLWSPHLSLMGLISGPKGEKLKTSIIDDTDNVHVGARMDPGSNALQIDLSRVPKPGRRWLHGWVMAPGAQSMDPVNVTVHSGVDSKLGTIQVIPQNVSPRWQEFWYYVGHIPENLSFSWQGITLLWGDVRLVSEVLTTDDLTRVLAGEIRRLSNQAYDETFMLQENDEKCYPILQHPGFGVDYVALPPVRVGLDRTLEVTYGVNPTMVDKSDGITFRLSVRDHAIKKELLFEDFLCPATNPKDRGWRTRRIPMRKHSRHLLTFIFEVDSGPEGNTNCDHALWREFKLIPSG